MIAQKCLFRTKKMAKLLDTAPWLGKWKDDIPKFQKQFQDFIDMDEMIIAKNVVDAEALLLPLIARMEKVHAAATCDS